MKLAGDFSGFVKFVISDSEDTVDIEKFNEEKTKAVKVENYDESYKSPVPEKDNIISNIKDINDFLKSATKDLEKLEIAKAIDEENPNKDNSNSQFKDENEIDDDCETVMEEPVRDDPPKQKREFPIQKCVIQKFPEHERRVSINSGKINMEVEGSSKLKSDEPKSKAIIEDIQEPSQSKIHCNELYKSDNLVVSYLTDIGKAHKTDDLLVSYITDMTKSDINNNENEVPLEYSNFTEQQRSALFSKSTNYPQIDDISKNDKSELTIFDSYMKSSNVESEFFTSSIVASHEVFTNNDYHEAN